MNNHTKNDTVVRKQLGHADILQRCAELINGFNRDFFDPDINFHRPVSFMALLLTPIEYNAIG